MRFLHFYPIAYFLLLVAAGVALWRGSVLSHVSPLRASSSRSPSSASGCCSR